MSQVFDDGATLDLLFLLDATQSMEKYIQSTKNSILEICSILHESGKLKRSKGLQIGLLAYRDYGDGGNDFAPVEQDDFVVRPYEFTYDMKVMEGYLTPLEAKGGGDRPEAFSTALEYAYGKMNGWRDESLKVIVVITEAAPHGINEDGDSFPNGYPKNKPVRDPLEIARDMARQNFNIFTLACEPTFGQTTKYAVEFYRALSDLTLGMFCSLTDHKFLAAIIIGFILEGLDLHKLSLEYQSDIARRFSDGLSIDQTVQELHEKLTSANQKVTTLKSGDIYKDMPIARHNYEVFMKSNTLADARKALKKVFLKRIDPRCLEAIERSEDTLVGKTDDNFHITVHFQNTGNHWIEMKSLNEAGTRISNDVIRDNHMLAKKFRINVPFNFILTRGRTEKCFSQTFSNNDTVDVARYFV